MNKYPDYIMRKLRQRRGLEPNDISSDEILNNFSPQQAFKEVLSWEGLINWDETIREWINDIYGINIDDNFVQAAPDMYEALKAYIEHVERFHGESGYPGNRCEWCLDREKEMCLALAKAEGEEGE